MSVRTSEFIINKEYLKSLYPCLDRWRNYLTHYSEFSGNAIDFLNLDKITWEDKKWVLFHKETFLPDTLLREFALTCAGRAVERCELQEIKDYFDLVLHICISEETSALNTAEYKTATSAADSAANSAANSATYWAAYWATYWAANWAANRAANRAANSAASSAADRAIEEETQKEMLIYLLEKN